MQEGNLLAAGPKQPWTGGAIAKGDSEIQQLIKGDPLYKKGLANYSIQAFDPIKMYPSLSSLIQAEKNK